MKLLTVVLCLIYNYFRAVEIVGVNDFEAFTFNNML